MSVPVVSVAGASNIRGLYPAITPAWQHDDEEGAPLLYSLGMLNDLTVTHARLSLTARFPSYAPGDALSLIARDRKIERGRNETQEAYAARARRWLDEHRVRGNAFALLRELRGWLNEPVRVATVDARTNWNIIEADGTETFLRLSDTGIAWNWDGAPATRWGRFWVIIDSIDGTPWGPGPKWGDPEWGEPGRTWGSTATLSEVATVRRIVRDWRPAGTRCEHIIINFDGSAFNPIDSFGMPTSGNWQSARNRFRGARYWRGTRAAA